MFVHKFTTELETGAPFNFQLDGGALYFTTETFKVLGGKSYPAWWGEMD
jgi:hypothetical protein